MHCLKDFSESLELWLVIEQEQNSIGEIETLFQRFLRLERERVRSLAAFKSEIAIEFLQNYVLSMRTTTPTRGKTF